MEHREIEHNSFVERLPLEIRYEVYRYLLSIKYTRHVCVARQLPVHAKLWPGHAYHLDPTILRTNRYIKSEASRILYHENVFVRIRSSDIHFGSLMNYKGIPHFLESRQAETFEHCAMSIDFDHQDTAVRLRSLCYVIALNDVRLLCESFMIVRNFVPDIFTCYMFRVTVYRKFDDISGNDRAPTLLQHRLLDAFTVLHGAPHFEIVGPVSSTYCSKIAAQVSRVVPPVEECFAEIVELWRAGRREFDRHDLRSAVKLYKMAYAQLMYSYFPRTVMRRNWAALHPGTERVALASEVLSRAQVAFLHFSLEEFDDAYFWASSPPLNDRITDMFGWERLQAKVVYLRALASVRLGNRQRGVKELCDGLGFVRKEVYRDKCLVNWRVCACRLLGLGGGAEGGEEDEEGFMLRQAMGLWG